MKPTRKREPQAEWPSELPPLGTYCRRISDDPETWVVGWLRRIADDIESGDLWALERHSQCWTRPFTDYEFTVALRVQDVDELSETDDSTAIR